MLFNVIALLKKHVVKTAQWDRSAENVLTFEKFRKLSQKEKIQWK